MAEMQCAIWWYFVEAFNWLKKAEESNFGRQNEKSKDVMKSTWSEPTKGDLTML